MKRLVIGLLVSFSFSAQAPAVPITYNMSGTVSRFDELPELPDFPGLAVGNDWWGSFTYESDAAFYDVTDIDPSLKTYSKNPALQPLAISVTVDAASEGTTYGFAGSYNASAGVWVANDSTLLGSLRDAFDLGFQETSGYPHSPGEEYVDLHVLLGDTSGSAFQDVTIPTRLDLNWFDTSYRQVNIFLRPDDSGPMELSLRIASMVAVPEPSTFVVWSSGLLTLLVWRRRR